MFATQTVMALATSATIVSVGGVESWIAFAEKFGIVAALLLYFVYRDYRSDQAQERRETELTTRVRKLEDDYRNLTKTTIEANTSAMNRCEQRHFTHG